MRALDYLEKNALSVAPFASNHFSKNEARVFFEDIEKLGGQVLIEDDAIMLNWDGPGEDYAESCTVVLPDNGIDALMILRRVNQENPDEVDYNAPEGILLWWD